VSAFEHALEAQSRLLNPQVIILEIDLPTFQARRVMTDLDEAALYDHYSLLHQHLLADARAFGLRHQVIRNTSGVRQLEEKLWAVLQRETEHE
jgi:hypothetical protein